MKVKPVELLLAGLHSYRETQRVDFAALCERGIFGIFGPTGSGKSTILDALTLALFGEVKRAAGYQGVINQQEDRARVAFTFEVGRGTERRCYRVERQLRKSGDFGAQTQECKLILLDQAGERVLADKDGQVKARIREILGLDADDFTRAVVLPQGRFHEFLTLRPADRRQMLERLFELDRFGEQLKKRVTEARSAAQNRLERVLAEQAGLGDCSPGALENARRELERSRAACRAAGERYRLAARRLEEARQVRELQQLRDDAQRRLAALRQNELRVRQAEERLEAGARAENLRGLLEEGEGLKSSLQARRERLAALQAEVRRLAERARQAEEEARRCQQARQEKEPGLLQLAAGLDRAVQEEQELDGWLEQEQALQRQLVDREKEISGLQSRREELRRRREQVERRLEQLRERREKLLVTPAEEERARRLFDLHREAARLAEEEEKLGARRAGAAAELERLREREAVLQQDMARLNTEARRCAERLHKLQQNPPVSREELESRAARLQLWQSRVERLQELVGQRRELEREYARLAKQIGLRREKREKAARRRESALAFLESAARRREEAARQLEECRRRHLAAVLARTLQEGRPCPVCGSPEHPSPAAAAGPDPEALERALAGAEEEEKRRRDELGVYEGELHRLDGELSALAPRVEQVLADKERVVGEMERARGDLPAAWRDADISELPVLAAGQQRDHQARQASLREWEKQVEEARAREKELRDKLDELRPALARVQSNIEGWRRYDVEQAGAAAELAARREAGMKELNPLLEASGLADPAAVPRYWESIRRRQEEYYRCGEEARKLEPELRQLSGNMQEADAALQDLSGQAGALREKLAGLRDMIERRRAELNALTGGRRAREALERVKAELGSLRDAAERAEKAGREAGEALNRARLELDSEQKTCSALAEQLQALTRKLEKAAQQARFTGIAHARDALLDPGERDRLAGQVEEYRRQEQLLSDRVRDLEEQLAGRSLDEQEWRRVQAEVQQAEENLGRARNREGAAENQLLQLEQRRDRWESLERERRQWSRRRELLGELEILLRGRALVEFMARRRLENLVARAAERLGRLTGYRYALELDGQGGFVLRDEGNGGLRRPVSSLSGGEIFLASLSLSLALSEQIQQRGRAPLEFFFLDEGFGALDERCLETVMDTLERLPMENISIGLISHVPQLINRLPRRLVVEPAGPGRGSRVRLELA